MFKTTIATMVAALMITGCAFDEEVPDGADTTTLHNELGTRATLDLAPTSLVGVVAVDGQGESLPCVQPDVGAVGCATASATS